MVKLPAWPGDDPLSHLPSLSMWLLSLLRCRDAATGVRLAIMIALAGVLAGPGALIMGAKGKMRNDPNAHWRVVCALVLAVPAVVDFSIPD